MAAPLIVEVMRGDQVESRHEVDAVVATADGTVLESWGDPDHPVLPRSSVKPVQALPLVTTGAADAFGLGSVELALSCSSHSGEDGHVGPLADWLARIGCSVDDLACGTHLPLAESAAAVLLAAGDPPGPLHNNCSGKHVGFLTVCRHLGLPTDGYLSADHPLHREHVTPAMAGAFGFDPDAQHPGVDGCGIPVWAVPLGHLAAGWAGIATAGPGRRLLDAMAAEPFFVAGSDRACTRLIREAGGAAVVKSGAEGVFCGALTGTGVGIALKARDGARRGSDAAITWLLDRLGVVDGAGPIPLTNHAGTRVGEVRVSDGGSTRAAP
ncbi:MAG: asparaginase [Acidimicrobiales bacterium]|jgi:L-asparaginase II|nr:asparaginase [Acidimicrobiales bacterium]